MKARWNPGNLAAILTVIVGTNSIRAQEGLGSMAPTRSPLLMVDGLPPSPLAYDLGPSKDVPAAPAGSESQTVPFIPFLLGDFVGPVADLFAEFKLAEGESPRPLDRAFFKYSYYDNINPTRWTEPIHYVNLDMYTLGMEKTFFDGTVSLGLRIPFYTMGAQAKDFRVGPDPTTGAVGVLAGGPGFNLSEFGSIVAIAKVVIWQDRKTGDLLSGGVAASIPTAGDQKLNPGLSTLMYVQPFSGFILTSDDWFVQGFSPMTLPVARPESIASFSDAGIGYYVYRDATCSRLLTAVAPTIEMHYTAPIRQANPNVTIFNILDDVRIHSTVDLTFGSTFVFRERATLGTGLSVTGDRPFDVEGLVRFN